MSTDKLFGEEARLDALFRHRILDSMPEQAYDDIVQLAKVICNVPITAISFVERDRQWFKACIGLQTSQTSREVSFCSRAIEQDDAIFEVEDAWNDERFRNNGLVTSDPHIRFYAGATITDEQGYKLGTVCVIDRVPRRLLPEQRLALAALARQVSQLLRRRMTEQERLENERFRVFLEQSPVVTFLKDASGAILYVNPTFYALFGKTPEQVLGKRYHDIWSDTFADRMLSQDRDVLQSNRPVVYEYTLTPDNQPQQFWQIYKFPLKGAGQMIGGIAIDVSDERRDIRTLEQEVNRLGVLSNTDSLTGVANRRVLDNCLKAEVNFSRRHQTPLAFLMVDIDRFKDFNDRFGHQTGDRLLASIAQTLSDNARLHDVVARYGGEEFGVILRNTNLHNAGLQAERLRSAIEKMPPRDITVSIGVAEFDPANDDETALMAAADAALYAAKNAGRNRIAIHSPAGPPGAGRRPAMAR